MTPGQPLGVADRGVMDKKKLAIFGGIAAVLIYHELKIRRVVNLVGDSMDVLHGHLEQDLQERMDLEFDEIVESYDE
jgi:hypothetical protein